MTSARRLLGVLESRLSPIQSSTLNVLMIKQQHRRILREAAR
jgi:hypothetical protein